ncbi:MAG: hypothetical protein LIQ30_01080, partial [Planctomycetes bacterium]|nr:hypothetical protein [Planctomycetota bacterium]
YETWAELFTTISSFIGREDGFYFRVPSSRNNRDSLDVTAGFQSRHLVYGHRVGVDVKYNVNLGKKATVQAVYAGVNVSF